MNDHTTLLPCIKRTLDIGPGHYIRSLQQYFHRAPPLIDITVRNVGEMPGDSGVVYENVCAGSTEFFFDRVKETFNIGGAGVVEELGEDTGGGVDGLDRVGGRLEGFGVGAHREEEGRSAGVGELFSNTLRAQLSANELLNMHLMP